MQGQSVMTARFRRPTSPRDQTWTGDRWNQRRTLELTQNRSPAEPLRHGSKSNRFRDPPDPAEPPAGLLPEAEHGPGTVWTDPGLRTVRGGVGQHPQGLHARGSERRARVPHRVLSAHTHHGRELEVRAQHPAGEFWSKWWKMMFRQSRQLQCIMGEGPARVYNRKWTKRTKNPEMLL